MAVSSEYIDHIVDLAKEVESEDAIDWGLTSINEEEAFRLMALNVVELMFDKYGQPGMRDVFLATIVKLVVENFVLNLKLKER